MRNESDSIVLNAVKLDSISKWYDIKLRRGNSLLTRLFANKETHPAEKISSNFFHALDAISFEVPQNASLGIIGENGAGKSTLLQIIAGIIRPSCGTLKVNGRVASLLELGSGFDLNFTGRENVVLNASILGLSKEEIQNRMDSILDFAEIGKFIDRKVKTYSTGMTLRLAFSVIAHVDADILIIDEALAVGDALFVQKCMKFIREFKKKGSLILVSHDFAAIQSLCSQCIWLSGGMVMSSGSTSKVLKEYHSYILNERNKQQGKKEIISNHSKSSNDSEILIKQVFLINADNGQVILDIKGDENVILEVCLNKTPNINDLVLGFIVRNRLGMDLFSQKVDLANSEANVTDVEISVISINFNFKMPRLAKGVYTIYTAVAERVASGDVLHHVWSDNSYVFKSNNTESFSGLFKVPMKKIIFT